MIHRGELVEQAVRNSGLSITKIAQRLGKSRRWMYLMFDNPNVDFETILKISKIINVDFSNELKLKPSVIIKSNEVNEDLENSLIYWKEKYFKLMEEHLDLLKNIKK